MNDKKDSEQVISNWKPAIILLSTVDRGPCFRYNFDRGCLAHFLERMTFDRNQSRAQMGAFELISSFLYSMTFLMAMIGKHLMSCG